MSGIELNRVCVDYPVHRIDSRKVAAGEEQKLGGRIFFARRREFVRALDRVNMNVKPGDRIGLIGSNGGGKSTLLKALAGILPVATGERKIEGRVATLFSTSAGIDMERTGEDNIHRLAALYNVPRQNVPALIESVAKFTELGIYLKMPFKTYSSGMKARLGFAVVTAIPADMVLIDEVIGVGDSVFYKKARERFETFLGQSASTVIASHSNSLLTAFCRRGFVLNRGRIVFRGPIRDAIQFHKDQSEGNIPTSQAESTD